MIKVNLNTLVLPSWGWHYEDLDLDHKLRSSLEKHGQLAPIIVREVNAHYEIVDGRRRLAQLKELGIEEAWILNTGQLSEPDAVRVAMSLELQSSVDYARLAQQVKALEDDGGLANTTPFSAERLRYLSQLCGFNWAQYEALAQDGFFDDEDTPEPLQVFDVPVETLPTVRAAPAKLTPVPTASAAQRLNAVIDFAPQSSLVPPVAEFKTITPVIDAWDETPVPALIPDVPSGGVQFFGVERVVSTWTPQEPPILDGIKDIVLNFETNGLRWYGGDRPIGVTVGTLDGQLKRFLPFGFTGGNLDPDVVKRWAKEQLRDKHITNAHVGFEVHMSREWGVDLEEQGCTFSDVMHYAAELDEYRREFALDILVRDFLHEEGPPRVDESRMDTYHAGDVALRAEYQVEAVAKLRNAMWPLLDREDLQRVRQLEDDVIPVVCEMEKNAAHVNRGKLRQWVAQSGEMLNACLWEVAKDLGFSMNPDSNEDWQKLFNHYGIPITQYTAPSTRYPQGQPSFTDGLLSKIEHPKVQLARRAGKLASLRSKFLLAYDEVIGDDCKLRFALHQLRGDEYGTARGRFSMSGGGRRQPRFGANLQQVFRVNSQREAFGYAHDDSSHDDEIFLVRALFEAEPFVRDDGSDADHLAADAQSIEYRLAAHYAKAEHLIEAYKADTAQLEAGELTKKWVDFHRVVGDVIRPYKDLSRNIIKNANFCLVYGGGRDTLANTLGLTRSESDQIYAVWHRMFPELSKLPEMTEGLARSRGYVKTITGRRARFRTEEELKWAHASINYVIQGSAADIMKTKLVELHRARKYTGLLLRLTVHDEADGDARLPETAQRVREVLNRQSFNLRVPIVWEVGTGSNWAVAK